MSAEDWPTWVAMARTGRRRGGPAVRPKPPGSPYYGKDPKDWADITRDLLTRHPLQGPDLVRATLASWDSIFHSRLGSGFHIGKEIKPTPQIMGFLLHALVPLELAKTHSGWRAELTSRDKDLVYIPDEAMSIEIKTSSHAKRIFGNRSFGVESAARGKKAKDGYYLAVNFEKWPEQGDALPRILAIRFGWLDHTDWMAQVSQTGQQSNLPADVDNNQLLILHQAG
jgi:hypothetical protein